jgi:hypothetical protein
MAIHFNGVKYERPESTGLFYGDQELFLIPGEQPGEYALVAPAGPRDPERLFSFGTRAQMLEEAEKSQRG